MTEHLVRLGVIGHGTVGAAFVRLVKQQSDTIAARSGVRLEVARVAVRNTAAHSGSVAADVMTTDAEFVVNDPTVDLVVELMGGVELPRKLILAALKNGKPVVTANKALLAQHGAELFAAADDAGIDLLFEAAVCGGIPLIRPLRESLRGEPIKRILGIVNGTTNYILTKMSEEGQSYADALVHRHSVMPKPTQLQMLRDWTQQQKSRSSPASHLVAMWWPATCTARGSARFLLPTLLLLVVLVMQ
jgi:homoserine dehydrogenase